MMALNVAGPSNSHKEAQQKAPAKPQFPEAFFCAHDCASSAGKFCAHDFMVLNFVLMILLFRVIASQSLIIRLMNSYLQS